MIVHLAEFFTGDSTGNLRQAIERMDFETALQELDRLGY